MSIPCTTSAGGYDYVWMGAPHNCYAWRVTPPPPAGNAAWEGHDPSEGSVYTCDVTACYLVGCAGWFVPGNATPPNPADLARSALDRMRLATPNIHMAPQPPLMTYVGLETWLWMDPGQWDPLSLTVTAGATSVTVVAEPVRAAWDLTAGSTTCTSAGRAWVNGMSSSEQTDCSYTFDQVSDGQPDGEFAVTSTLTYQVDWTCSGACLTGNGTLGEVDGLPGAQRSGSASDSRSSSDEGSETRVSTVTERGTSKGEARSQRAACGGLAGWWPAERGGSSAAPKPVVGSGDAGGAAGRRSGSRGGGLGPAGRAEGVGARDRCSRSRRGR